MKSLIMAALLAISSTVSATEPALKFPVMNDAEGLARVILKQCGSKGVIIIAVVVDGKLEKYLIDCHVTKLGS